MQPFMDTEVVREREAWYKAGAAAVAMYSSVGVLAIGVVTGLASAIWNFEATSVAVATAIMCCAWIAAANGIVVLQARQVARRGEVNVDRY
jgi:hypothetical protein